MSTAALPDSPQPSSQTDSAGPQTDFDPDSFRMTVGEHLEELRTRIILAVVGFFIAMIACLAFSERVMIFFCKPLIHQFEVHHMPLQMFYSNLTDPFMTYLRIAMITAAAIAGPWVIYQLWLFVAAGLYPHERKMITRYIPLSVSLFIAGLVFVYYLVLPLSIKFFIEFSGSLRVPIPEAVSQSVDSSALYKVPVIAGDPRSPQPGDMWFDGTRQVLKMFVPDASASAGHGIIRTIPFGPESMVAPIITIGEYIDLTLTFMVTFGVAFQLPLVLLAVVSIGIVDVNWLRKQRKIVFFGMTVASAFIAPGDIVTSMLALLIPLVLLYEFGLWLAILGQKRKAKAAAMES